MKRIVLVLLVAPRSRIVSDRRRHRRRLGGRPRIGSPPTLPVDESGRRRRKLPTDLGIAPSRPNARPPSVPPAVVVRSPTARPPRRTRGGRRDEPPADPATERSRSRREIATGRDSEAGAPRPRRTISTRAETRSERRHRRRRHWYRRGPAVRRRRTPTRRLPFATSSADRASTVGEFLDQHAQRRDRPPRAGGRRGAELRRARPGVRGPRGLRRGGQGVPEGARHRVLVHGSA